MTAVLIEPAIRTRLRLVPAPVSEPAYDDEPGIRPVLTLWPIDPTASRSASGPSGGP